MDDITVAQHVLEVKTAFLVGSAVMATLGSISIRKYYREGRQYAEYRNAGAFATAVAVLVALRAIF